MQSKRLMSDVSRAESVTRSVIWYASVCMRLRAATRMPMMRSPWGAIPPISKLLCDRDPVKGEELASQPTLSRFENSVDRADLYRMGIALADTVIERHRRRLKRKAKRAARARSFAWRRQGSRRRVFQWGMSLRREA